MRHVLWMGGPPASGKTTVATRLARRHGLRWYSADTRTWAHRDRAVRAGNLAAIRWETMSPAERWSVPAGEMLELSLHRERGPMVVEDLRALPRSPLVVAEGTTLPAYTVRDRSRAVWLLPSPDFQQRVFDERRLPAGPRKLYEAMTRTIESDVREHGLPTLVVDSADTVEATVAAVERLFGPALAAAPRAETLTQRRSLLREANEAIVAQIRGYHARQGAEGTADEVVRSFLCECGDPECKLGVDISVAVAAAAPVLATRHR